VARHRRPLVEEPPLELLTFGATTGLVTMSCRRWRGGIGPGLSGRRLIRMISVWVGHMLDMLRERAAFRRGLS
jgi:hypothetical protein